MFQAVFILSAFLSLLWLAGMWRQLRRPWMRIALMAAMAPVLTSLTWFFLARMNMASESRAATALGAVWLVLAVPFGVIPCLAAWWMRRVWRGIKRLLACAHPLANPSGAPTPRDSHAAFSRRQLIFGSATTALSTLPLLVTYGAAGKGLAQADDFRVRRLVVPVPGLPPALEGLRVAHVSDTHVGGFTPDSNLGRIAEQIAAWKPEVILFTGDLVDHSLNALPASLDFLEKMRQIAPLVCCEGNHDLLFNRPGEKEALREALRRKNFDWMLEGRAKRLVLRGESVDVFGASWGSDTEERSEKLKEAAQKLRQGAFPILLMHHPECWDEAAGAGFPLTLSGHTHGGQLMLTETCGAGPLVFKRWSGLYTKPNASLVISNGAGHWFPLRVNAPAEIGFLTLRRA